MIFRSKSLPVHKKAINNELAAEFQYHIPEKRRNSIKMSCISGAIMQLEQCKIEEVTPINDQPDINENANQVDILPETIIQEEEKLVTNPINESHQEMKPENEVSITVVLEVSRFSFIL